jgi:hypothetical protein
VTCGVPHGPTLSNFFYDGVLRVPTSEGVKLLAFEDDVAVVSVAYYAALVEEIMNKTLTGIDGLMTNNGLSLVPEKSECVILTGKHALSLHQPVIKGYRLPVKKDIGTINIWDSIFLSWVTIANEKKRFNRYSTEETRISSISPLYSALLSIYIN